MSDGPNAAGWGLPFGFTRSQGNWSSENVRETATDYIRTARRSINAGTGATTGAVVMGALAGAALLFPSGFIAAAFGAAIAGGCWLFLGGAIGHGLNVALGILDGWLNPRREQTPPPQDRGPERAAPRDGSRGPGPGSDAGDEFTTDSADRTARDPNPTITRRVREPSSPTRRVTPDRIDRVDDAAGRDGPHRI